jgi:uncharacterized membrane protein YbhN (UPF0104 family)
MVGGLAVSLTFSLMTFGEIRHGAAGYEFVPRLQAADLKSALHQTHWTAVALFVLLTMASVPLRAIQWGDIVSPRGSFRDRYHATAIGYMAINLLPARLGEVSRGLLLAYRVPGLSRSLSVGSVIYGRVFDILLVWFMVLPLPFLLHVQPGSRTFLIEGMVALTVLAWGAVALSWVAQKHGPWAGRQISNMLGDTVGAGFTRFCQGFGPGVGPPAITRAFLWTLSFQAVAAAAYVPVLQQVCPGIPPVSAAVFSFAAVSVGLALPSTPSGIGIYHFAVTTALTSIGATPAQAIAVAIITHLASLAGFVIPGLASIAIDWPSGLRLRQGLREEAEQT